MKWIHICLLFVAFNLSCTQSKIIIDPDRATSKELGIRSVQYDRTMAKHSLDERENNYSILKQGPQAPVKDAYNKTYETSPVNVSSLPDITTERRIALVIGNSNYVKGDSLSNPINDAKAMARLLHDLQFKVMKHENVCQTEMKKAIDDFGRNLTNGRYDVSLFFYAGHGVQVNGFNYLIPTDADINSEDDVEYNCVRAGRILSKMEDAGCKTNIIILDACRNNPFERSWTRGIQVNGKGLAFMTAPSGSLIAYATSPGNTAADGEAGKNGIYTSALLHHMQTPNITIEEMFKRVRVTVEELTGKRQTPWESTSLKGNFFFKVQR